jgi:predicted outer membrane repeat protein
MLDGFTITGGNGEKGGGIYIHGGRGPAILNCIIADNQASESGGGIYNWASPQIANCVFCGNSSGKGGGLYTHAGSPKLTNCTLGNNTAVVEGGGLYVYGRAGYPELSNCILWGNSDSGGSDESAQAHVNYTYESTTIFNHCCIEDWTGILIGMGNFGTEPLFSDPNDRDYRLKSQGGRWDANEGRWVIDDVTSPCIDAGDPMSAIGLEPFANGGIVNMGAYGGTSEASKSYFGEPPCERVVAGDINGDCRIDFEDFRLMGLHWCKDSQP